jgi:hypothetical protein
MHCSLGKNFIGICIRVYCSRLFLTENTMSHYTSVQELWRTCDVSFNNGERVKSRTFSYRVRTGTEWGNYQFRCNESTVGNVQRTLVGATSGNRPDLALNLPSPFYLVSLFFYYENFLLFSSRRGEWTSRRRHQWRCLVLLDWLHDLRIQIGVCVLLWLPSSV